MAGKRSDSTNHSRYTFFTSGSSLMFNTTRVPTREFPQTVITEVGLHGPYVYTVTQTFEPHTQTSLITFSVLSTHLFTHATKTGKWQWIAKCQKYMENMCFFICTFPANSRALNTTTPPMSTTYEVYCWPTRWHTTVLFFCKRSQPPRWAKKLTETCSQAFFFVFCFFTAVQINVKEI